MTKSNDLRRLNNLAQNLGSATTKKFQQAVDQSASALAVLGPLKLILIAKGAEEEDVASHLARWLAEECPDIMKQTHQMLKSRADGRAVLETSVKDLLDIDSVLAWRTIDDEAVSYITQMKLYAKAARVGE